MDPIHIEELTARDVRAFFELRLRGLTEHPEAFGEAAEDFANRPLEQHTARIESLREIGGFILAARDAPAGEWVGVVGMKPDTGLKTRHNAFLWGMYVPRERQSRGIGRRLVEAALERCRREGRIELVRLSVVTVNQPAISLYRSLGFVDYGIDPGGIRVDGRDYDEILMICRTGGRAQVNRV